MCDGQYRATCVRPQMDPVECKIDILQNELLVAILSYLSVKEAAKTCLVSRRWRYLWQHTTGCLEIYDKNRCTKVQDVINQVLKLHQGPTLDQFRVGISFTGNCHWIDHWIKFAIRKEVKLFELNLAAGRGLGGGLSYYYFPEIWKLSSGDIGKLKFSRFCCNLKSLSLVTVHIREKDVNFFLSNCPRLEQICISGSNVLKNLKVTRPLPSLKSMEISCCSNIRVLEVDAPNLESFTYVGPNILVPLQNSPRLTELSVGGLYCYYFFFNADKHTSYSTKLRKLKLTAPQEVMLGSCLTFTYPDNFPRLDNLRELELDLTLEAGQSLLFFTFFCKSSPLLSRFTAQMTYYQVLAEERMSDAANAEHAARLATRFVHKHLKVVKLIGFTGCTSDFNLALHLLEIGSSLKEIILQPTNDRHHPKVIKMASTEERSKQLGAKLPPGAKLVML